MGQALGFCCHMPWSPCPEAYRRDLTPLQMMQMQSVATCLWPRCFLQLTHSVTQQVCAGSSCEPRAAASEVNGVQDHTLMVGDRPISGPAAIPRYMRWPGAQKSRLQVEIPSLTSSEAPSNPALSGRPFLARHRMCHQTWLAL